MWDKDVGDDVTWMTVPGSGHGSASSLTPLGKAPGAAGDTPAQLQTELLQPLLKVNLSREQSKLAASHCVCVT